MLATSAASASSRLSLRALSTSARIRAPAPAPAPAPAAGFFQRPSDVPQPSTNAAVATRKLKVAVPHTPPHVPSEQAPNYPATWSETQNPRELAMSGPRFEQIDMQSQPQPLSAMEMIQREPIRLTPNRVQSCDGGDGALGHPKVFINLDKPGPKACPYCGLRYERDHSHH